MALKLKGSTSGFVAIDAPSVAGNNTLILPENTGSAQQLLGNDITAGVTTFTSVTVNRNGDLTVPGTISIGGTLTYEDVTSVDSVGIVTARSGVRINGGGLTIIGDTTGLKASGISTFGGDVSVTGVSTFTDNISIVKAGGPILELCNNTNTTTMALRLHEGTAGSLVNGGGMIYDGASNKLHITCGTNLRTERITVNRDNGNVGVGLTSPEELFHTRTSSGTNRNLIEASASHAFLRLKAGSTSYNSGLEFYSGSSNISNLTALGGGGFSFEVGGSERLRIDSSGNVLTQGNTQLFGSNTSDGSDNKAIMINGGGAVSDSRGGYLLVHGNEHSSNPGITRLHAGNVGTAFIAFNTAGTERLRIDSNGKIGVGGAPSAWQAATTSNVLQLGTACLFNYNNDYFHVGQNFYYDGSNYKYVANDPATRLLQDNGKFTFYQAASGSADANITWTEALHIASDGNVHINTTDNGTANSKVNIEDSSSVGVNVLKLINKPSSSNGKARLELYAETSGGQGATAYIQSISGTDADGSNSANDAGLEFHTGYGGSGTDVTAVKIDNSGKMRFSSHEGNDLLHLTPLTASSTSIILNTYADNSSGRNWAIRNRYTDHGRLEFMRGTTNTDSPLSTIMYLQGSSVHIAGTLSKNAGSFKIPHPLVGLSTTKDLVHSFIEGPQMDLIYRGKVTLSSGAATVNLDTVSNMTEGTFVVLNRDVQCFTTNETGWGAVKGSVSGNILTISAQDDSSTDTISWMVIGERQDDTVKSLDMTDDNGDLIVEPPKETGVSLEGG